MAVRRTLGVKEYISELLYEGRIEDNPYHEKHGISDSHYLKPTHIIERNKNFFIAQQLSHYLEFDESERVRVVSNPDFYAPFELAYFPNNLEHAEILSKSEVRRHGPQEMLPGSAAVLYASYNKNSCLLWLCALQYCFRQGSPPELTRSLASKYMGARYHLLKSFFGLDSILEIDKIFISHRVLSKTMNQDILDRVISEYRLEFSRSDREDLDVTVLELGK